MASAPVLSRPREFTYTPLGTARAAAVAGIAGISVLAAALRFADFTRVAANPYYDAAVRSMGHSWHDFFYGALEPGGQISIDKTPVDLWLQVALTKLLGFSSITLRLAPALAGTIAVVVLYDLVRRGCGRAAGLAAALAFAVLPASVLTSRSDTMDALMGMLLVLAGWLVLRAPAGKRAPAVIAAGAVAGLAFEVKLFEAAVALPALAVLAWLALAEAPAHKARTLALAGVAFVVVAAAWGVTASLLPGRHPYPLGSTDGQIWNVLLVYNGWDRLHSASTGPTAPSLLRLFATKPPRPFGPLIGAEVLCAIVFGALAAACATPTAVSADAQRRRRAIVWGMASWLALGALVESLSGRGWPRYLEAFSPAVAAVLGVAVVTLARVAQGRRRAIAALCVCAAAAAVAGPLTGGAPGPSLAAVDTALTAMVVLALAAAVPPARSRAVQAGAALVLVAALVVPTATTLSLVRSGANDAETTGATPAHRLHLLSTFLRHHQGKARYEVAGATIFQTAALIVHDDRPVLTLVGVNRRPLLTLKQFRREIRLGRVRYALLGTQRCRPGASYACSPVVRWVRRHGVDVGRQAGLLSHRRLYRL